VIQCHRQQHPASAKALCSNSSEHSAQRILSEFICICDDDNDRLGCSVNEQRLSDIGHCASASVSMFGVGDSTAALAFGNSNSFSFSVQQQPLWRHASDGSNTFGCSS
jgi:hypothetical protein